MKKLIIGLTAVLTLAVATPALAAHHSSHYWICHDPVQKAAWAYPTGTYWANQLAHYGAYYAANNAYYVAHYGC